MTNHPNRGRLRPVATCTDRAVIIGEARTAEDALAMLRAWVVAAGISEVIIGVKIARVMIDMPSPEQDRSPEAWIPVPANAGLTR